MRRWGEVDLVRTILGFRAEIRQGRDRSKLTLKQAVRTEMAAGERDWPLVEDRRAWKAAICPADPVICGISDITHVCILERNQIKCFL